MDLTWKHPFTCVISGPTGSGKTRFVQRFLSYLNEMVTPLPDQIVWCYGKWQPRYAGLRHNVIDFVEGLHNLKDWDSNTKRLVIIDDLMSETDDRVTKLFTKGSHHLNISVIYIVQNLFGKNKEQRTISLNSHYLVVFKNPRDASQILHLAKQMYPGRGTFV